MDAVSETEEPDIPPNSILEITLTRPNPPLIFPTKIKQNSINLDVILLSFISWPIKIKSGRAIKVYESIPANNIWGITFNNSLLKIRK
tara:strand:- start:290 stop:553 length:264 start_codon:yes stop_codon:yes gene_type:complete